MKKVAGNNANKEAVMKRILIADDEPFIRQLLSVTLLGFEIVVADSGTSALESVKHLRPEVVLLDVAMPGMNGVDVLQAIRSDPEMRHIPVVMLTGEHHLRDEAIAYGATEFLEKPFRPFALIDLIDRLTGRAIETLPLAS